MTKVLRHRMIALCIKRLPSNGAAVDIYRCYIKPVTLPCQPTQSRRNGFLWTKEFVCEITCKAFKDRNKGKTIMH